MDCGHPRILCASSGTGMLLTKPYLTLFPTGYFRPLFPTGGHNDPPTNF